ETARVDGDPDSRDAAESLPAAGLRGVPPALDADAPGRDVPSEREGSGMDPSRMGGPERVLAPGLGHRSQGAGRRDSDTPDGHDHGRGDRFASGNPEWGKSKVATNRLMVRETG